MKGPLLGDLEHVVRRVFVIDQDQVEFAVRVNVEELAPVTQMFDELPISVDIGVEMAKFPEQGSLGFGIARVQFPHLGVEQVVEEQRAVLGAVGGGNVRVKAAPLLGFLTGHNSPSDGLGVFENPVLDGFVFSGCWHAL